MIGSPIVKLHRGSQPIIRDSTPNSCFRQSQDDNINNDNDKNKQDVNKVLVQTFNNRSTRTQTKAIIIIHIRSLSPRRILAKKRDK